MAPTQTLQEANYWVGRPRAMLIWDSAVSPGKFRVVRVGWGHPRGAGGETQRARPPAGGGTGLAAYKGVGGAVLSHRAAPAVPSAQRGLTSEFGMGSGVSPALLPPTVCPGTGGEVLRATLLLVCACAGASRSVMPVPVSEPVKPHGPLVRLGCMHCCTSTCRLSTQWSSAALQGALRPGKIHLGQGFPLRCFQRLSRPDLATRRCIWQHNRYTRDPSVPVLSY
jgi:hypothetical protein